MQRLCNIENLEALRTIKFNARILHFWRYSPILATVSPTFFPSGGRVGKWFLSFMEEKPFLHLFPMDILKKGLNIISPFKTVIDHIGMLKDIHDQNRHSS